MFNYYNLKNIIGLQNKTDPIREYLLDIHVPNYNKIYRASSSAKLRFCIPDNFSMAYNLMFFNIGFPIGWPSGEVDRSNDVESVRIFISTIDTEFSLVLITEYMIESLVLLRRRKAA